MTEGISLEGYSPAEVPVLLLPYQQQWVSNIVEPEPVSFFDLHTKSRRIGLSWADASGAALVGSQERGRNTFYIGYEKEMTRGYIQDASDWAKLYDLAASEIEEDEEVWREGDEDKAIQVFRLHFNSGKKIEALSSKPRNLRSRQGDVVLDEAAFHDDLPGMLKAARALRIWGGRIRLITTYNGVDNDYYELEQQVIAGKLPYRRSFTTFLDAIEQGFFKRICLIEGRQWSQQAQQEFLRQTLEEFGEDADEELLCIPKKGGGKYFSRVLVESCMKVDLPVIRYSCPDAFALESEDQRWQKTQAWLEEYVAPVLAVFDPGLRSFYGSDFARSADLSAWFFGQQQPNLTRCVNFALELRNVPFRQQEQILFYCCDRLPRFTAGAMDARGNGQYLAEVAMQRYGSRVEAVMATDSFYLENFPRYRAGMQDGKFMLPADGDLLDDHGLVELIQGTPKIPAERRTKGRDGKQRHGDGAIAGLLFWYASTLETVPIEFETLGQPRPSLVGFGGDRSSSMKGFI
ncbi:hypothetical protein AB3R30_18845 [Leptolyngbyaceae cyanobacterium UHCC 1019]